VEVEIVSLRNDNIMIRLLSVSMLYLMLLLTPSVSQAQGPNLGSTANFALFTAVGAFNNSGATIVNGDIGTNEGAFTGFPPGVVNGNIHVADPVSVQAAIDVTIAYGEISTYPCGLVHGTTLGNGETLTPNTYCLGAASSLNETLILDGECDPNSYFIFKIDGAFSTSANSNIVLINSASICNVFWQINGAVSLAANSVVRGTFLINGAISLASGAAILGRGLATAGAIELIMNYVDIDSSPEASTISAIGPTTFCSGGSVELIGNCGGIWNTGETTPTLTVTTTGDYFVNNTNTCGGISSNIIHVTVAPGPLCEIEAVPIICEGDTTVLCVQTGASSYVWNTGETDNCITVSTGGTYSVTVTDVSGCSSLCSLTVIVNACLNISGTIFWKGNGKDGVKDVTVTLSGDDSDTSLTNEAGMYNLVANTGDDFVITPVKNINLLNGVDVADATRISQHMAGNYLTDFYRKVSADVNKSYTLSTVDAALIKQALLGNPAAIAIFTTTGSWRFVDTDFNPPISKVFVIPTFPSTRTITGASVDLTGQDFYGVKIGDVLDNADPQNFSSEPIPPMVWMVRDRSLTVGETFDVEFSVQDWKNIAAFQNAFNFDPSILEYVDFEVLQSIPDFNKEENFSAANAHIGELRVLFTVANGIEVGDASKVFKFRFKVLQSTSKLSEVLSLSNTGLNPIAYTEQLISTEVKLVFTEGSLNSENPDHSAKVELLQNLPNPFYAYTTIGFILPTSMDVKLNIYDTSSRMLWSTEKNYGMGYQEEKIILDTRLAPGIYFYELTTQHGSITRRMILIKE